MTPEPPPGTRISVELVPDANRLLRLVDAGRIAANTHLPLPNARDIQTGLIYTVAIIGLESAGLVRLSTTVQHAVDFRTRTSEPRRYWRLTEAGCIALAGNRGADDGNPGSPSPQERQP
jgi:hypothetical protein